MKGSFILKSFTSAKWAQKISTEPYRGLGRFFLGFLGFIWVFLFGDLYCMRTLVSEWPYFRLWKP